MATHEEGNEYDVIFCGGGTAACIAAGRLAKADPNLAVLIVEGGRSNLNDPTVIHPASFLAHLAPDSQTACFYQAKADKNLNDREVIVPTGGILGGGSSINFMMYTRAQGCDYDSWKTEGWDYKSLLPLFKKLETYHMDDPEIDKSVHGYDGPINISTGTHVPKSPQEDFLAATESVGMKTFPDLGDFKSCGGFARWPRYVGPDGKRQDTAHRYIHNQNLPNLHLQLESKVVRVLFNDDKKAVGVEYEPSASFQPQIALSKPVSRIVKARRLVVVSAGALGSPAILERSGIGSVELLSSLGVDVISELPAVGLIPRRYPYKTSLKPEDTMDRIVNGNVDFSQAVTDKDPILGSNYIDVAGKTRPTDEEASALGTEFKEVWDRDFKDYPERPLMIVAILNSFLGDHTSLPPISPPIQYATVANYTAYPYSRGSIHITDSRSTSLNKLSFDSGFLSHSADVAIQLWAYKKQREIFRRTNAYAGELIFGHPAFPKGSQAALNDGPVEGVKEKGGFRTHGEDGGGVDRKEVRDLEYTTEDDEVIRGFIRENINTTWHSLGTCRMKSREEGGVVSGRLDVHGVTGLKVADLSICPENVAANTNNTALVVGEKAAVLIAEDLGIKL